MNAWSDSSDYRQLIFILVTLLSVDFVLGLLALQNFWELPIFSRLATFPITCLKLSWASCNDDWWQDRIPEWIYRKGRVSE